MALAAVRADANSMPDGFAAGDAGRSELSAPTAATPTAPSISSRRVTPRTRSSTLNRADADVEQAAVENAEQEHRNGVRAQHDPEAEVRRDRPALIRLVEVHHLDDAQVVERADDGEQHGRDGKPGHVDVQHRLDDVELREEADEGRYARRAEHEDEHHEREPGAAVVEPLVVIDVVGLEAPVRHEENHAKRANSHDR